MPKSATCTVIRGEQALPRAKDLKELLDRLGAAQEQHEKRRKSGEDDFLEAYNAAKLENEIYDMAPPGPYWGYAGDDLKVSFIVLARLKRANQGANIHTFQVELGVLVGKVTYKPMLLDLMDFFGEVCRSRGLGEGQHRGPRFWHFD